MSNLTKFGSVGMVCAQVATLSRVVVAVVGLGVAGSAALAETAQPAWLSPLPSSYEIAVAETIAPVIAARCSQKFEISEASIRAVEATLSKAYVAAGLGTLAEVRKAARPDKAKREVEIKRLLDTYNRENNTNGWKPEVWCPLGEKEFAKNSLISQFLLRKGNS